MIRSRSTQAFFDDIRKYKFLTDPECRELCKLAQEGDSSAEQRLVESHIRLAINIAARYSYTYQQDIDEMIQEANIGLLNGIRKYPVGKDIPFFIVAQRYIKSAIENYMLKYKWQFPITNKHIRIYKYIRDNNFELSFEEVAEHFDCEVKTVQQTLIMQHAIMLNDVAYQDGSTTEIIDTIADESDAFQESNSALAANAILNRIPEDQRLILQAHFGIGCQQLSNDTIGLAIGKTSGRVSQIINKQIKCLRKSKDVKKYLEETL